MSTETTKRRHVCPCCKCGFWERAEYEAHMERMLALLTAALQESKTKGKAAA